MRKYSGWIPRFDPAGKLFPPPPGYYDIAKSSPATKPDKLRPCEVDGKVCIFHRWADADEAIVKINVRCRKEEHKALVDAIARDNYIPPEASCDIIRRTVALVEYPDGSVGKVDPSLVTFLDKEVK